MNGREHATVGTSDRDTQAYPDGTTDAETADAMRHTTAADEGFSFAAWLADGDRFDAEDTANTDPLEPTTTDRSNESVGPFSGLADVSVHPARVATYALFCAVSVLTILSATGYVPPLGPAAGFAV